MAIIGNIPYFQTNPCRSLKGKSNCDPPHSDKSGTALRRCSLASRSKKWVGSKIIKIWGLKLVKHGKTGVLPTLQFFFLAGIHQPFESIDFDVFFSYDLGCSMARHGFFIAKGIPLLGVLYPFWVCCYMMLHGSLCFLFPPNRPSLNRLV